MITLVPGAKKGQIEKLCLFALIGGTKYFPKYPAFAWIYLPVIPVFALNVLWVE